MTRIAKAKPKVQLITTAGGHQTFVKRIRQLEHEKGIYELFRDFCELSYCAIAKRMAQTPDRADELEKRYMQIVNSYRNKDVVRAFPELLAIAATAISEGGTDFLGKVAGELELLNRAGAQFFTPYDVAKCMALMTLHDIGPTIAEKGYLTICEPASGAGVMILAAADALKEQGFDPHTQMLVDATDISQLCFHMTYLQLTMRGIPARVERGNSLSLEKYEEAWTPSIVGFCNKHNLNKVADAAD
jgi:type I restriction-modification system DNA methylase subunit